MIVVEMKDGRVKVRKGTVDEICEAIYLLVQLIPVGRVASYKNIGSLLGVHPRVVALCLRRNDKPVIIPCHRVVYESGRLGGYGLGGTEIKKKLLILEGVIFEDDETVSKVSFIHLEDLLYNDAQ